MGLFSLMIIPYLLIFAIPVVMLIWVMVRGLTLPRGLRRGRAAVCGRCAHEIALGIDGAEHPSMPLRCPECGRPYLKAGVLTLGLAKKARPGTAMTIVCWTLLAAGGTLVAIGFAASFSAMNSANTMRQSFTQTIGSKASGFNVRFDGDLTFQWGSAVTDGDLTLTVRPALGPAASVEIDPATGSWSIPTTGEAGAVFDEAAALSLFTAARIDTTLLSVVSDATQLAGAVGYIRRQPDSAMHDVLAVRQTGVLGTPTVVAAAPASWTPDSLMVTSEDRWGTSLRFSFESDTIDAGHTGTRSAAAYNGSVGFEYEQADAVQVTFITLIVRPPEGWPIAVRYELGGTGGTLARGRITEEYQPASDAEAIETIAEAARLMLPSGSIDPGLADVAALIHDVRTDLALYVPSVDSLSALSSAFQHARGGFTTTVPAAQGYSGVVAGFQPPVAALVTGGVGVLVWIAGIVGVVMRRNGLYPSSVLAVNASVSEA